MSELLGMDFFRNAFLMGLLLSLLFGLLSFFVVMRKMAFLGAGIAHTAFGGVALGVLLGVDPFYASLVFCLVAAVFIGRLAKSGNVSYDRRTFSSGLELMSTANITSFTLVFS